MAKVLTFVALNHYSRGEGVEDPLIWGLVPQINPSLDNISNYFPLYAVPLLSQGVWRYAKITIEVVCYEKKII